MNTTDNTYPGSSIKKPKPVSDKDAQAMVDEYVKGKNIDALAEDYGYTVAQVTEVVVKDGEAPEQRLQADEPVAPTKKGK